MSEAPKLSSTVNAELMTNAVYQTVDGRICEAYKYSKGQEFSDLLSWLLHLKLPFNAIAQQVVARLPWNYSITQIQKVISRCQLCFQRVAEPNSIVTKKWESVAPKFASNDGQKKLKRNSGDSVSRIKF
jgi:hypothetical protein